MTSFRFHVVALPHTQTSRLHCGCAYTMKVLNFCRMMRSLGHTVFHYGAEGSQADCSEHVSVISQEEQRLLCGTQDWRRETYRIAWDERAPYWQLCNSRAVAEILRRKQARDFVCLIGGSCQRTIADHVGNDVLCVEFGVGYRGVFAKYRVFESYAHQARIYGAQQPDGDGNFYDAVIPNYYDPADFPFCPKKQDYFLYIGRLIRRKGIQVAVETTRAIGARLLIAGQGIDRIEPGRIVTTEGHCYEGAHLQYVGFADVARRAELMGNARAVFVPTLYLEPFGGVNVEAQLCGTPVITTDWGVSRDGRTRRERLSLPDARAVRLGSATRRSTRSPGNPRSCGPDVLAGPRPPDVRRVFHDALGSVGQGVVHAAGADATRLARALGQQHSRLNRFPSTLERMDFAWQLTWTKGCRSTTRPAATWRPGRSWCKGSWWAWRSWPFRPTRWAR